MQEKNGVRSFVFYEILRLEFDLVALIILFGKIDVTTSLIIINNWRDSHTVLVSVQWLFF